MRPKSRRPASARPRRALRGARLGGACVALLWIACGEGSAGPDLAPRLLHDEAEMARYLEEFPAHAFEIVDVAGVGRFYMDDNPTLVKQALREGRPWAPHLLEQFREHVVPGTTVLDVGAHIGSLSVPLARLVGAEGRLYAFEPQKRVYRELVHNLRLNGLEQASALRFALSSEPGIIEMTPHFIDDGWARIGEGGDEAEARTLDSFGFSNVSLVKIDVEGHELAVLQGAEQTVARSRPVLIIEIRPSEIRAVGGLLGRWGYSLRRIPGEGMDYIAAPRRP